MGYFSFTRYPVRCYLLPRKQITTCSAGGGTYKFTLGEWQATVVQDGELKGNGSFFLQPDFVVQRVFDFYNPGQELSASQNALLLQRSNNVLLFDAGLGSFGGPAVGKLPSRLTAAGIDPSAVTGVLITHAHGDHVLGLFNAAFGRTFPNARIYIGRLEAEFWQRQPEVLAREAPDLPFSLVSTLNAPSVYSRTSASQLLIDASCLTAGHTPGHMSYRITSGSKSIFVIGDAVTSRSTTIQNPEWNTFSDTFRNKAVQTRYNTLDGLVRTKELVLAYHERFPGLGYIIPDGPAFDWTAYARLS
eukprot:IDg3929t1